MLGVLDVSFIYWKDHPRLNVGVLNAGFVVFPSDGEPGFSI